MSEEPINNSPEVPDVIAVDFCPVPFVPFAKIGRLKRNCTITEKIDGTNAQIHISEGGQIYAGSRTRWIYPGKQTDNFGFAAWVKANAEELMKLGPGTHYGEWWGQGIQRTYGLTEKRFSLFNVERWRDGRQERPSCCGVVPVLYEGDFDSTAIDQTFESLKLNGSSAGFGFPNPEGIVIYHVATKTYFKRTFEHDEEFVASEARNKKHSGDGPNA